MKRVILLYNSISDLYTKISSPPQSCGPHVLCLMSMNMASSPLPLLLHLLLYYTMMYGRLQFLALRAINTILCCLIITLIFYGRSHYTKNLTGTAILLILLHMLTLSLAPCQSVFKMTMTLNSSTMPPLPSSLSMVLRYVFHARISATK